MFSSIEDVANVALRRIGYPTPIGMIYEGSPAARAVVDVYAEIVSALLRAEDHEFSRKVQTLSLTGNIAPLFWSYEFLYPVDCLKVRQVIPATRSNPPMPISWDVGTTLIAAVQTTVIWSNTQSPKMVYTTNNVTESDWDAGFVETVVQYLVLAVGSVLASKDTNRGATADHVDMERIIRSDVGKDS